MKNYEVELKFEGHVFINVQAEDEELAVEKAIATFDSGNITIDDIYDINAYTEEVRD
jgi:hypothetical protein